MPRDEEEASLLAHSTDVPALPPLLPPLPTKHLQHLRGCALAIGRGQPANNLASSKENAMQLCHTQMLRTSAQPRRC